MAQKETSLLLKDLCARLPYDIKVQCYKYPRPVTILYVGNINEVKFVETGGIEHINSIKLYLRPLSSMTDEEKKELLHFGGLHISASGEVIDVSCVGFERHSEVQDWLNKHHFDFRGLIEKDLALEAPKDMYIFN